MLFCCETRDCRVSISRSPERERERERVSRGEEGGGGVEVQLRRCEMRNRDSASPRRSIALLPVATQYRPLDAHRVGRGVAGRWLDRGFEGGGRVIPFRLRLPRLASHAIARSIPSNQSARTRVLTPSHLARVSLSRNDLPGT